MWSNGTVATFIEDLKSNADYKNHNKKVIRFSCKKYETTATESEKTSRTSKAQGSITLVFILVSALHTFRSLHKSCMS